MISDEMGYIIRADLATRRAKPLGKRGEGVGFKVR